MSWFQQLAVSLSTPSAGRDDFERDRETLFRYLERAELEQCRQILLVQRLGRELARVQAERVNAEQKMRQLDQDVELALAEKRPALARRQMRLLLVERRRIEQLGVQCTELLERQNVAQKVQQEQATRLARLLSRAASVTEGPASSTVAGEPESISEEDIELELLHRTQNRQERLPTEEGEGHA